MTTQKITTATPNAQRIIQNPPAWEVVAAARNFKRAANVAAEVSPVVAAQRAGDADYDWCIERGLGGEQAAIAYHPAYQRLARMPGGCGPVCSCNLCRDEFGVKGSALCRP
jgi:hypothetical protein